jgi:hypothetical protein
MQTFDPGADASFGCTVHLTVTRKQLIVHWATREGAELGRRFYPRTAKGLASAERTIQKRIDEGYLFPQEDPRAREIL